MTNERHNGVGWACCHTDISSPYLDFLEQRLPAKNPFSLLLMFLLSPFGILLFYFEEKPEVRSWKIKRSSRVIVRMYRRLAAFTAKHFNELQSFIDPWSPIVAFFLGGAFLVFAAPHLAPSIFSVAMAPLILSLASVLTNSLTLVFLNMLAEKARGARARCSLHGVNNIIGHKVWAEKKTFSLLQDIMSKAQGDRAKWHVINFLSHLVDDRIVRNEPGGLFVLATPTEGWHDATYSAFLSTNIEHAEHRILWLVDPDDFSEVLFPMCVKLAMATYGIAYKRPGKNGGKGGRDNLWCKSSSCLAYFEPMMEDMTPSAKREIVQQLDALMQKHNAAHNLRGERHMNESNLDLPESSLCLVKDTSHAWWTDFDEVILPGLALFGVHALNEKKVDPNDNDLHRRSFKHLQHMLLNGAFPHMDAFRRASAPECCRLLLLGVKRSKGTTNQEHGSIETQGLGITEKQAIDDIAAALWKHFTQIEGISSLASDFSLTSLLETALVLFEEFCGGKDSIVVQCANDTMTVPENVRLDVGVYDDKYAVWSETTEEPNHRFVRWYFFPQGLAHARSVLGSEDCVFRQCIESLVSINDAALGDCKRRDNATSYEYFRQEILARFKTFEEHEKANRTA